MNNAIAKYLKDMKPKDIHLKISNNNDITVDTIANIKNGKTRSIKQEYMEKFAKFLNKDIKELEEEQKNHLLLLDEKVNIEKILNLSIESKIILFNKLKNDEDLKKIINEKENNINLLDDIEYDNDLNNKIILDTIDNIDFIEIDEINKILFDDKYKIAKKNYDMEKYHIEKIENILVKSKSHLQELYKIYNSVLMYNINKLTKIDSERDEVVSEEEIAEMMKDEESSFIDEDFFDKFDTGQ